MTTAKQPVSQQASFKVEGMDCLSCVQTVEAAVNRMPGITALNLNFTAEKMRVTFDPAQTRLEDFARVIQPLGYTVRWLEEKTAGQPLEPETAHNHEAHHDHSEEFAAGTPWWQTRSGRPVLVSGGLLVAAWLFGQLEPNLGTWGYILATTLGGWTFARKAYQGASVGNPWTINTLMSVAALGAILIGQAAEAATVVFLFAVGELLEGVAAGRARAGIRALTALAPKTAFVLHGDHEHEVAADSLEIGQTVRVKPGGRVPADGIILSGSSALDDSPITGESVPVNKSIGDTVYAGSINADGLITVRVDRAASDNTVARIIRMVEEAENSQAPTARFIDRFSRVYTPGVMLVAALVIVIPPLLLGGAWHEWIYKGLSLLLIGCPCALLISVPAAVTSGISSGARRGILIKGGATLEAMGTVKTIAFDKTGTLTAGKPSVTDTIPLSGDEASLLRLAGAVETASSHPLAGAIVAKAKALKLELPAVEEAGALQGKAATARIGGLEYAVGSPKYAAGLEPLSAETQTQIATLERAGKTVVVLLAGSEAVGLIALRDEPRADARAAIAGLKTLGVSSLMLTGDNARTGNAIAAELGLEVKAELMPEDKLALIGALKIQGKVGMIGDGINDAPALAAADIGIAMGGGTDVALETADAALLRNRVGDVVDLVRLSRATMGNITQNIVIALGLKVIFLVTTLLGITSLWMAILADTGATVLVTANALRLLRYRFR